MKKQFSVLLIMSLLVIPVKAQKVTEYNYKLDNGIVIKTERCWNQVWVQQSFSPLTAADKSPLSISMTALGEIKAAVSFKLISAGKEVKLQDAKPGTYDLKLSFKLSGKPGTLSFIANNIEIKDKTKTSVSITLYDYQILIDEIPTPASGLASYETLVIKSKNNPVQDLYFGVPTFYAKGNHEAPVTPDEAASNTKGKIKSGTYDVLVTINIGNQSQKIWFENFTFKGDIKYKITTNLNSAIISYTGGNKDVKAIHLYPAGTSAKQSGNPAPVKNLEIIKYDSPAALNSCSPGSYDILLNFKDGAKYEWRKNIAATTGVRAEVK